MKFPDFSKTVCYNLRIPWPIMKIPNFFLFPRLRTLQKHNRTKAANVQILQVKKHFTYDSCLRRVTHLIVLLPVLGVPVLAVSWVVHRTIMSLHKTQQNGINVNTYLLISDQTSGRYYCSLLWRVRRNPYVTVLHINVYKLTLESEWLTSI